MAEFCHTKEQQMNITITGSLGHIGKPLTEELVQKGHVVTVVSSNAGRQKDIESLGAKAAIGSIEDDRFLAKALTGADAAYLMTPPDFFEPDQVAYYERIALAYATAIQRSGVKRALYLSSYGAELPSGTGFITGSHKAENLLDGIAGVTVTHMRPTFFYYNLFAFIDMIKAAGSISAVYGGGDKLALVSPRDIASAIAREITQPDNAARICYVTSDDRSCSEIARVLGSAIGKPDLQWNILPRDTALQSLLRAGMPINAAENLVELGTAIHTGRLRHDFDRNKPAFGNVSLEEFAKEFAEVYYRKEQYHH